MENASKALIIAGAILLSILIIGLGMMVFNNAKSALDGANLDAEQIDAFNSKFENYLGNSVKGSNVRSLCDLVKSNNATLDDEDTESERRITIKYDTSEQTSQSGINTIKQSIKTGKYYTVTAEYNDAKLISIITINVKSGGTSDTPSGS